MKNDERHNTPVDDVLAMQARKCAAHYFKLTLIGFQELTQ